MLVPATLHEISLPLAEQVIDDGSEDVPKVMLPLFLDDLASGHFPYLPSLLRRNEESPR